MPPRRDTSGKPVVAVANRLPIRHGDEGWELSPGGLVTALRPVMDSRSGIWVGWDGGTKGTPETLPTSQTRLLPIGLSAAQVRQYYHGFANATLWPLLHDAIEKPRFERSWWRGYQDVSATFTDAAVAALADCQDALAWVHDYHLALVPGLAGRTLLLGVDRLDYTKGIVERLLALEALLDRRPDLRTKMAFLQIAVPSRDNVAEYRSLRTAIEGHVGRINGRFTEPGSDVPVHYLHRALSPGQLVAYYAIADMMLVTPLIDGMNLVAKEYVTAQQALGCSGSMILSEFAGVGSELPEAIRCNPFDVEGLSLRIEHALELQPDVRRAAIKAMAAHVESHDVHRWVAGQLADIEAASRPVGRIQPGSRMLLAGRCPDAALSPYRQEAAARRKRSTA